MKIILTAVDDPLYRAWYEHCGELEGVEVHRGSILDLRCDAVVSPANSFGFMDGGIDLLYGQRFGPELQQRLQRVIREQHHGELLVGQAEILETHDERIPHLITAPTMRVPMVLRQSVNAYFAARAALLLVEHDTFVEGSRRGRPIAEVVQSLAFPGLGTGVGNLSPETCARQVRAAIDEVRGRIGFPESWIEAQRRHQLLYTDRVHDLQQDLPHTSYDRTLQRMQRRFQRLSRRRRR